LGHVCHEVCLEEIIFTSGDKPFCSEGCVFGSIFGNVEFLKEHGRNRNFQKLHAAQVIRFEVLELVHGTWNLNVTWGQILHVYIQSMSAICCASVVRAGIDRNTSSEKHLAEKQGQIVRRSKRPCTCSSCKVIQVHGICAHSYSARTLRGFLTRTRSTACQVRHKRRRILCRARCAAAVAVKSISIVTLFGTTPTAITAHYSTHTDISRTHLPVQVLPGTRIKLLHLAR